MKITKYIALIFVFLFLLSLFTGCATLRKEDEIITSVENLYPNSKFTKVEASVTEDGLDSKKYYFSNGDFEFYFCDYILEGPMGFDSNATLCNYYEQLLDFKSEEINKLYDDTSIPFFRKSNNPDNYYSKDDVKAFANEHCFRGEYYPPVLELDIDNFYFEFYIEEYSQIKECIDFISDFYDIIKDYVPKTSLEFCDSTTIYFNTSKSYSYTENETTKTSDFIYRANIVLSQKDINIENIEKWVEYKYAVLVKNGRINDSKIDVDKVKEPILNKLYIDGEEFESKKYNTLFYYNAEDKKYYTEVSYGIKSDSYGGMEDYLQREIIQEYYKNSDYSIDTKGKETTYKINKDKYKMNWTLEPFATIDENSTLNFYKNNKKLEIEVLTEIGLIDVDKKHNRFISVDDFAEIMGMKVDEIDQETRAIYLTTK